MATLSPKEIGRQASRIFAATLLTGWAFRSQEDQEDYGVDGEIELIAPGEKPTGFIFKVQVKGQEVANLIHEGDVVSLSLKTTKLAYYLRQLRTPIVLVVVGVASGRCWWLPLHGNHDVLQRLANAEASGDGQVAIHVPTRNELPGTADRMLADVALMMNYLTVQRLKDMTLPDAAAVFAREPDLDEVERNLKLKQAVVRSQKTQRLINEARLEDAFNLNKRAFADDSETVAGRFSAGMELVRIGLGLSANKPEQMSDDALLKLRLDVYHRLVSFTVCLAPDHHLRHYSLFLARCARLRVFVDRDVGILMSQQHQLATLDASSKLYVMGAHQRVRDRVVSELRRAQRRIALMMEFQWYPVVVYAWRELTEAVTPFLAVLKHDGLEQAIAAIRTWLDAVGRFCLYYAGLSRDPDLIAMSALNFVQIGLDTDDTGTREQDARNAINQIEDADKRAIVLGLLERLAALTAEMARVEVWTLADVESKVRQMARGMGIDVDDPHDELAQIIRIGIKDYNPERVLRECLHLFTEVESYGIPAEMLGLPTAGSKTVLCMKHGHRSTGLELDRVFLPFRSRWCESCPDRAPRPEGWRWTHEWHEAEGTRLFGLQSRAAGSPRRPEGRGTEPDAANSMPRRLDGVDLDAAESAPRRCDGNEP